MILTVYYEIGPRWKRKIKALGREFPNPMPEDKQGYWFDKIGRGLNVVGTMAQHYTGRKLEST